MKKLSIFAMLAFALLAASCSNKDKESPIDFYTATVTFRPQADGSYYLKQDDSTALVPKNESLKKYPFAAGVEKRALVQYAFDPANPGTAVVPGYKFTKEVSLMAIDTIYTKAPIAADAFEGKAEDPVALYLGEKTFPTTMIEDGYLNIVFEFRYANRTHEINLLTGVNPEDPYEVKFVHNSNGDAYMVNRSSIVAFPLKSLPDTEGRTVKLTLKWNSLVSGKEESVSFDYCSRQDW